MRQRSAARDRAGATSAATSAPVTDPAATSAATSAAAAAAAAATAQPLRTRRFFLGGLAVGVLAMSATGLAAASLVESPRDVAARSAAPAPAVLTAFARWHVLTDTFTVAGVVTAARTIAVTASAPFRVITVTRMPTRVGDRVRPGHVIAEIDGRPLLLLRGRLPAYRDLHEGDSGPDVAQLQEALERLRYADFDPAGLFGPSTALALRLLYRHLGYNPPLYHPRPNTSDLLIPDVYLPMSEVAFIPGKSALVVSVSAQVGTVVPRGHPVLRLAAGHPYVAGAISAQAAELVRPGMPARISLISPGPAIAGVLTRVGQLPLPRGSGDLRARGSASTGIAATEYPIEVAGRRPLPQRLIGATVWLTLTAPVTARSVLSVPVAAIFGSARGRPAHVTRIAADGRRTNVTVSTGPMADGLVAVQSITPGALRAGDRVLIGIGRAP